MYLFINIENLGTVDIVIVDYDKTARLQLINQLQKLKGIYV